MEAGLGSEWGRNEAGMKPEWRIRVPVLCRRERFGTSLPLPQAMSGVFPLVQCHGVALLSLQRQNRLLRANLRGIADLHIPAKFRQAKSSPSVKFCGRICHYTFSLCCSSLTFNNFQNHKNVRRTKTSLKGQTSWLSIFSNLTKMYSNLWEATCGLWVFLR